MITFFFLATERKKVNKRKIAGSRCGAKNRLYLLNKKNSFHTNSFLFLTEIQPIFFTHLHYMPEQAKRC